MKWLSTIVFTLTVPCLYGQIAFSEVSKTLGIDSPTGNFGVAIGDFNNDGYDDLFIARDASHLSNQLYLNDEGKQFINVSYLINDPSVRSIAGLWADLDNNGFVDLLVVNRRDEPKQLYMNYGDGQFVNVTFQAGITDMSETKSANAADFNGDGWVDILFNNFKSENSLYRNNGDGTFTNVIEGSGASSLYNAMGAVMFDYDGDHQIDMFLTYDGQEFELFRNTGNFKFENISKIANVNYKGFGMGVDLADINFDGKMDIYVTNLYENTLLVSQDNGVYRDISASAHVQDMGMGWGTHFIDVNNDMHPDIYVVNQYNFSPYDNILYLNMGDGVFVNGNVNILRSRFDGFGSAVVDFNLDGQMDLMVANRNALFQLFQNNTETGNWLKIRLNDPTGNTQAIGATVKLTTGERTLTDIVKAGSGFSSQSTGNIHFGLGHHTNVDKMEVIWPDGESEIHENLAVNNFLILIRGSYLAPFFEGQLNEIYSPEDKTVDVLSLDNPLEVYLWPMPATHYLDIKYDQGLGAVYYLLDISGKQMIKSIFTSEVTRVDLRELTSGVYILAIESNGHLLTHKIIVQNN